MINSLFAHLHWNPSRIFFTLPIVGHDIVWYGVLFALGFLVTYFILRQVLKREVCLVTDAPSSSSKNNNFSQYVADKMTLYIVCGLIIGARLGYVFFYGWPLYRNNLMDIFKIWMGGLASHGACAGILIATFFLVLRLRKVGELFSYTFFLDVLALISGFFAFFIRLGNFVNQEIIGKVSHLPWAVVFLDPFDGGEILPRHPVQLYEGFFYLTLAVVLIVLWTKKVWPTGKGLYAALFLSLLFSFRFAIEFFKEPQGYVMPLYKGLSMGQYLSIPFILGGLILIAFHYRKKLKNT